MRRLACVPTTPEERQMRHPLRAGLAMLAIVAILALLTTPTVLADRGPGFDATVTEDFVFRGCTFAVDPTAVDLCGSATTNLKRYRAASTTTVITGFSPLPSGCYVDTHTTTLAFADREQSTISLDIVGVLCPTGGGNFTFSGTYAVSRGALVFPRIASTSMVLSQITPRVTWLPWNPVRV